MHYGQRMLLTYFTQVDLNQLVIVTAGVWDKTFLILFSKLSNICETQDK